MRTEKSKQMNAVRRHDRNKSWSKDIKINNFSIEVGGRYLLENASMTLAMGKKYGLVGRNGIGKTTLLNFIVRRDIENLPEMGEVLLVEQEVEATDKSVLETLLEADIERTELLEKMKRLETSDSGQLESGETLAQVQERLAEIEYDKAEPKAASILAGLGFSVDVIHRPTKSFSGGWRMRVSIAKALFCEPDLLFLDEPQTKNPPIISLKYFFHSIFQKNIPSVFFKDFPSNFSFNFFHLSGLFFL
jgi:ATP-binding cassette, subfamily F, member 3